MPSHYTGYKPCLHNYGRHPTDPVDLFDVSERTQQESAQQFCKYMRRHWDIAYRQMKRAIAVQSKYYDGHHRLVKCNVGDLV